MMVYSLGPSLDWSWLRGPALIRAYTTVTSLSPVCPLFEPIVVCLISGFNLNQRNLKWRIH